MDEELAIEFLRTQNYQVFDCNWRCRTDEVDTMTLSPNPILAFVEVKTHSTQRHDTLAETVVRTKLTWVRCVMRAWSWVHEAPFRHDIDLSLVSVKWDGIGQATVTRRRKLE